MKHVLLTGTNGFIGRHCIPGLLKAGYEIHGVSRQAGTIPDIIWHQVDLLEVAQVKQLLRQIQPSHLLHLAWNVKPGSYWTSLDNFRWVRASLELLEAFVAHGGQRLCMVGTCAEYGWSASLCSEYETPLTPTTPYGICKHALQTMVDSFGKQTGISCAWARLFYLYGSYENPSRLVPSVIRALLRNQSIPCTHGELIRDVLYVSDVGNALVALLDSEVIGSVNVASGIPIMLKDIISTIGKQLNKESLIQLGALPLSLDDSPSIVADIRRLKEEVHWSPEFSLEVGIARSIAWWQEFAAINADI